MIESLRDILHRMWAVILDQTEILIPKILAGIVILLIGLIFARIIRGLTARFFLAIRMDRISDRMGISAYLARGDVRHTVAEILATTIYWLVLLFSLHLLGLALGLQEMANFFGSIIGYLPRIVVALVILIAGIAIGSFFGSAVQLTMSNTGFPAAKPLGAGVKYLIGFFALVMALEQLQIATQLLVATLQIVIASIALALALAYGLGCRELARDSVKGWLSRNQNPAQESVTGVEDSQLSSQ